MRAPKKRRASTGVKTGGKALVERRTKASRARKPSSGTAKKSPDKVVPTATQKRGTVHKEKVKGNKGKTGRRIPVATSPRAGAVATVRGHGKVGSKGDVIRGGEAQALGPTGQEAHLPVVTVMAAVKPGDEKEVAGLAKVAVTRAGEAHGADSSLKEQSTPGHPDAGTGAGDVEDLPLLPIPIASFTI
jgi:hypothetical protein